MKDQTKMIAGVIVVLAITGGFWLFNTLDSPRLENLQSDILNSASNDSEIVDGVYTNNNIGFSVEIPDGYEIYSEEYDVRLFAGNGPIGDRIHLEFTDNAQHGISIFHVSTSSDPIFKVFERFHIGDLYLVEEVEELAWNASLVRHYDGVLLIFKPENTNEYFEIVVDDRVENQEDILMEMYESFEYHY